MLQIGCRTRYDQTKTIVNITDLKIALALNFQGMQSKTTLRVYSQRL